MIYLYLITHVICGLLSAGLLFASNQGNWPNIAVQDRNADLKHAYGVGLIAGPAALSSTLVFLAFSPNQFKHGIKFK